MGAFGYKNALHEDCFEEDVLTVLKDVMDQGFSLDEPHLEEEVDEDEEDSYDPEQDAEATIALLFRTLEPEVCIDQKAEEKTEDDEEAGDGRCKECKDEGQWQDGHVREDAVADTLQGDLRGVIGILSEACTEVGQSKQHTVHDDGIEKGYPEFTTIRITGEVGSQEIV